MCGIAVLYGQAHNAGLSIVREMLGLIQHRGFKNFELGYASNCVLGANRLDIVDRDNGYQPVWNEDKTICAVLSGEIYNHQELRGALELKGHQIKTLCDTEVLVHAYEEYGPDFVKKLDGMFAFVLYDNQSGKLLAARDPFGIKPLYMAYGPRNILAFASEMKSFIPLNISKASLVPPGHYFWDDKIVQYYELPCSTTNLPFNLAQDQLRTLLHRSVSKMVNTDLPLAVFLSGGIDSAIVLYLAKALHPNVAAVSIGIRGSPDLASARKLCAYWGVKHIWAEFEKLELEGLYENIIYHLESFEPNLVRASIFTFLMSSLAHQQGYRVALAGEGSDELFAGYADFMLMDDYVEIQQELGKFFKDLHRTQLLRWDKISMACTVEVRYPFMDKQVVEFAWNLPVEFKIYHDQAGGKTKYLLRSAYADVLPADIADRQKVPMDEGACPDGKRQLDQLINSYVSRDGECHIDAHIVKDYKLATLEERYNFLAFARNYGFADFTRDRIKVRKK